MKHEWRKHEKQYYIPQTTPEIVTIPTFKFLMIKGQGSPDSLEFQACIQVLYGIAYAIRMMPKKGIQLAGYYEYTVYPLEGIWDLTEQGRRSEILIKDELVYTLMIRQPDFVTETVVAKAIEIVRKKNDSQLLSHVSFETITEGECVQMLHVGSFEDEPKTMAIIKHFCEKQGVTIASLAHREIYVSDFRRVIPEKRKTVLRYILK
ncbi:MAG: GyrI-like domain-containing protein [Culicoidibacterales bacterium]